jgi:hypothetical protein
MGHGYTAAMKIHRSLLTLALFGICSTAFAQWQWLDADGRKVYSDRAPPPEVSEKNILKRPGAGSRPAAPVAAEAGAADQSPLPLNAASAPESALDKELQAKKKQAADAEAAKRRADEERVTKTKIENCARAKQAKMNMDSGVRMSHTNAAGEREIMDDAARSSERARIQTIINSECR